MSLNLMWSAIAYGELVLSVAKKCFIIILTNGLLLNLCPVKD